MCNKQIDPDQILDPSLIDDSFIEKTNAAFEAGLKLAKGSYQKNIVLGLATVSGSSLRGKSRIWSCNYATSARNLIDRIEASGIGGETTSFVKGRKALMFGPCYELWKMIPHALSRSKEHTEYRKDAEKLYTALENLNFDEIRVHLAKLSVSVVAMRREELKLNIMKCLE